MREKRRDNRINSARRRLLKAAATGLSVGTALALFPPVSWGAAMRSGGDGGNRADSLKKLVVYFSMPETDDPDNMTRDEANSTVVIDGKVLGNTQYVAGLIQRHTGADIFRIVPKKPYPSDHDTLVDMAEKEKRNRVRPEIVGEVPHINDYDVIFLGYPNWYADMPMILYTFLETYDLSGKTIVPFNTHGGSRFSRTIRTIASLQPNATVVQNGFTVSRDDVEDSEKSLISWLRELGY